MFIRAKADWPNDRRIMLRVKPGPNGCWIWTGSRTGGGGNYGSITIGGVGFLVHRVSYETFIGPIPEGLTIDHLCMVPLCVNPSHLEAVTVAENVRRAAAAVTECPRGHAYEGENILLKKGHRHCRECDRVRSREYQRRRRAADRAAREVAA